MKHYTVSFVEEFKGNTKEEIHCLLLEFLKFCVENENLSSFDIIESN